MKKLIVLFLGFLVMTGHIKADPAHEDPGIGEMIDSLTRQEMSANGCHRGIVYVVDTRMGRLIAHSSLEGTDRIVPFTDMFYREAEFVQGAVTYLALLSSGEITPDTEIDTGNGQYVMPHGELVKDHNWRRGGYGLISMESVLTHRSIVGYTKALDLAYGNSMCDYFLKRRDYTAGVPETLTGLLTFYNAIANGGCMVKICNPGDSTVTVINGQLASPEHIRLLQQGLERCVSEGLYKKAGSEHVDIAACGRILKISDTTYRLELCGYFPVTNPQYTVMVVMEKENLPASAGGMCGPLFRRIADGLLSYYKGMESKND